MLIIDGNLFLLSIFSVFFDQIFVNITKVVKNVNNNVTSFTFQYICDLPIGFIRVFWLKFLMIFLKHRPFESKMSPSTLFVPL